MRAVHARTRPAVAALRRWGLKVQGPGRSSRLPFGGFEVPRPDAKPGPDHRWRSHAGSSSAGHCCRRRDCFASTSDRIEFVNRKSRWLRISSSLSPASPASANHANDVRNSRDNDGISRPGAVSNTCASRLARAPITDLESPSPRCSEETYASTASPIGPTPAGTPFNPEPPAAHAPPHTATYTTCGPQTGVLDSDDSAPPHYQALRLPSPTQRYVTRTLRNAGRDLFTEDPLRGPSGKGIRRAPRP
jgi:hypothetical protein